MDYIYDFQDWNYLAEGNLHIVLSYEGENQQMKNKVMRIHKQTNQKSEQKHIIYEMMSQMKYPIIDNLMAKTQKIHMEQQYKTIFLQGVQAKITPLRPQHRLSRAIDFNKDIQIQENLFSEYADLIKEHVQNSYNIEIKPKSPLPIYSTNEDIETKFFKVQLQKVQAQLGMPFEEISLEQIQQNISKYDPQSFFNSQSEECILNFFLVPQNNFKVFQKGKEVKDLQGFLNQECIKIVHNSLAQSSILQQIFYMQSRPVKTIEETLQYLNELNDISQAEIEESLSNLHEISENSIVNKIRSICNFLLMMTWSDISIIGNYICTTQPIDNIALKDFQFFQKEALYVYFRFSIIDYDLKEISKLQNYKKQSDILNKIYEIYLQKFK